MQRPRLRVVSWTARWASAFLALWYLGLGTQAVWVVLDVLVHADTVEVEPDFPCASHNCGCRTAEQCRTQCCCAPKPAEPACHAQADQPSCHAESAEPTPPDTVVAVPLHTQVSFVSAAHCAGSLPGGAWPGARAFDVHLPIHTVGVDFVGLDEDLDTPQYRRSASVFREPPDKIPIAPFLA